MKKEAPIVSPDDNDEDGLLFTLSNPAFANKKPEPLPNSSRRKSRFFFNIQPTLANEAKARAKALAPKTLEHVDDNILKRLREYRKELPPELAANIDKIREFFLMEISPLTLAVTPGADQATDVIQKLLGSNLDGAVMLQFERMLRKGVDIKISKYVTKYLGLPEEESTKILDAISPVRKEAVYLSNPLQNQAPSKELWTPQGNTK